MIEEKIKMWTIFTDGPHTNKNTKKNKLKNEKIITKT